MIYDFFYLIFTCFLNMSGSALFVAALIGIFAGALCWVACFYYTRLWHKRFHVKAQHHLLCAVAALFTVFFTIQFRALGNLEHIVDGIIDNWHEYLNEDGYFHSETYELAYYTLKDDYPVVFAGVPQPGSSDTYIPFANDDMRQICVAIYVAEACANFSTHHPFLNLMLTTRAGVSQEEIENDVKEFFGRNPGAVYPLKRAVDIAAGHIRESLLEQSPKTVWKTRLISVFLFLILQLLPFGIIGYLAYKDLEKLKNERYKHLNERGNLSGKSPKTVVLVLASAFALGSCSPPYYKDKRATDDNFKRQEYFARDVSQSPSAQPATPTPSTGDVHVLLKWNNYNDLDLHCVDPSGVEIYYNNKKSPTGGILEIDMNADEFSRNSNPIENIYWPTGRAPEGTYSVYLVYYAMHDNVDETSYTIEVKYGDKTEVFQGTIRSTDPKRHICTFNFNN